MMTENQQSMLQAFSDSAMDIARKRWFPRDEQARKKLQPEEVAEKLAKYPNITKAAAYGWLTGHSFPSQRQAEFLLIVLTQNTEWLDNDHLLKAGNDLLDQRDNLQNSFSNSPPPPMTDDEMRQALAPKHTIMGLGGHSGILTIHDTVGLEPRKHPDLVAGKAKPRRYEALNVKDLQNIQSTTRNLSEFLHVSRLLYDGGMTREALAAKMPNSLANSWQSIGNYETGVAKSGTLLPSSATLKAILNILLPDNTALHERAGKMLCRNRAQIAYLAYQNPELDSVKSIGHHEAVQPRPYFIEKLRRHAGGKIEDSPDWSNNPPIETVPIERNYQYLKTLRMALGLTMKKVAEQTGLAISTIEHSERFYADDHYAPIRLQLLKHYLNCAAKDKHVEPYASRKAYDALESGPLESHAQRAKGPEDPVQGSQRLP